LGYLNSFQERASGVDYFNRDIIRFSFIHDENIIQLELILFGG
jgi:hypothetical protein